MGFGDKRLQHGRFQIQDLGPERLDVEANSRLTVCQSLVVRVAFSNYGPLYPQWVRHIAVGMFLNDNLHGFHERNILVIPALASDNSRLSGSVHAGGKNSEECARPRAQRRNTGGGPSNLPQPPCERILLRPGTVALQWGVLVAVALGVGSSFSLAETLENPAAPAPAKTAAATPWSQIGAKARADYKGERIGHCSHR